MCNIDAIFGNSDIFLDNISDSFETNGCIFLQTLTLCVKSYLEVMYRRKK